MSTTPNPIRRAAISRVQSSASFIGRPTGENKRRLSMPIKEISPDERQAPLEIFTAPRARRSCQLVPEEGKTAEEATTSTATSTTVKGNETPRRRSTQSSQKTPNLSEKRKNEGEGAEDQETPKKEAELETPSAPLRKRPTKSGIRDSGIAPPRLVF